MAPATETEPMSTSLVREPRSVSIAIAPTLRSLPFRSVIVTAVVLSVAVVSAMETSSVVTS